MWYPSSLIIVNLFSYEKSTIDFKDRIGRISCIYGSNQTDPKTLSNGSGKTSLLDCISIGLTGSPLRQINKKDIVRNGYISGSLELTLVNDVLKSELLIKISIDRSKSNKVEIYENGKLNTQLKDLAPKESHKYVLDLVDISESDLLNYYLLGKDTYQSFFTTKDSEKKEVINRFSRANIVDPIEGFIKTDIIDKDEEIIVIEKDIAAFNAKVEVLEEQLQDLKLIDKNQVKKDIIEKIQLNILDISESNERLELEINELKSDKEKSKQEYDLLEEDKSIDEEFIKLTKAIDTLSIGIQKNREIYLNIDKKYELKIKEVDKRISDEEIDIRLCKTEQGLTKDMISEIERHLADEIECPSCHHKFCFKDKEYDIENAKTILMPQLQKQIINKDKYIVAREKVIVEQKLARHKILTDKKAEQEESIKDGKVLTSAMQQLSIKETGLKRDLQFHQQKLNNINIQISKIETNLKIKQDQIEIYNKQIESLLNQIDEEEKKEVEDKTIQLTEQIDKISEGILLYNQALEQLLSEKESIESWKLRFKKFKSYLANNSIGMIESLANHFLQEMKTHLSVSIDGFKEKTNGDLKEEITVEISRDGGVSLESFQKFSGGEKAKIDVSGILAMQKLINLNSKSGGLDLLWIDEIVDAIDRIALGELIVSLDNIGQTILLISHIDLPEVENSIKVEKKLGISLIIN